MVKAWTRFNAAQQTAVFAPCIDRCFRLQAEAQSRKRKHDEDAGPDLLLLLPPAMKSIRADSSLAAAPLRRTEAEGAAVDT
jgi:hypothetical protein